MIDVLVAGGGPVGLGTAILAAQAGLTVTVVEPQGGGPLDKACGEGLMPEAVDLLRGMGVALEGFPFVGIRYVDASRDASGDASGAHAQGRFPRGHGLGVRRLALHAALLARADALGVRRVEGRVAGVRQDAHGVDAAGLRARFLVAADGLHSTVRRELGLSLPPRAPGRFGLRRHFAVAPWGDEVEVHWATDAEAYVTPVAPDLVGVAILFSGAPGRGGFDGLLRRFPTLAARLGAPVTQARGAGPFEQRVRRRVVGRVLLVGDAAGYLDPLTGEGVRLGLASARELVRCVAADRPRAYEQAWRRVARRYWVMTSLLLRARRSPLRPAMIPLLRACPWLFDQALRQLATS